MCFTRRKNESTNQHCVRIRLEDMFSINSIASGMGDLTPNGHFIEAAAKQYGMLSIQANAKYARFVFPTKTIAKAFRKTIKHKVKEAKVYPYTSEIVNKA